MYQIFATPGIVLRKVAVGEANILASILTRDLGLVRAQVRSARVTPSKLRYGIEPLTSGRFSFVRGRHEWRLTGAEAESRAVLALPPTHRAVAGRVSKLLVRLMPGAEPLEAVYRAVEGSFTALVGATEEEAQGMEYVLVLRILSHLGYIAPTASVSPFLLGEEFPNDLLAQALTSRPILVRAINESLQATGL